MRFDYHMHLEYGSYDEDYAEDSSVRQSSAASMRSDFRSTPIPFPSSSSFTMTILSWTTVLWGSFSGNG